ncbi:MAG: radical SAM protein [Deltaproteobacteria bacterium]|nr:radical SAM protein [Deltaproteobacteria bacterium]
MAKTCILCPRECKTDRENEKKGFCGIGWSPVVASATLHLGEEPPISGVNGSGTIFFVGCNMACVYCQNYPISQLRNTGREITVDELVDTILHLQRSGAHNINFVTPSHVVHNVAEAIFLSRKRGLHIPIVYNTSSYDKEEVIDLLEGLVDIYLADFRYFDNNVAKKYSNAFDYPDVAKKALKKMYEQVGDLKTKDNIAYKGLLIRILVLPSLARQVKKILDWIRENLSKSSYISLMSQYFPAYRAAEFPEINRKITEEEWEEVKETFFNLGFENGYIQER